MMNSPIFKTTLYENGISYSLLNRNFLLCASQALGLFKFSIQLQTWVKQFEIWNLSASLQYTAYNSNTNK